MISSSCCRGVGDVEGKGDGIVMLVTEEVVSLRELGLPSTVQGVFY